MAIIKLRAGDFGAGTEITFGDTALHLPNPMVPGGSERVPFAALAEIEAVGDENKDRLFGALKMSLNGAAVLGPVGLAAGALAARKVKDIAFTARLADGREFAAVTDAKTFATLREYLLKAHNGDAEKSDAASDDAIDRMLAKYLEKMGPRAETPHLGGWLEARASIEPATPVTEVAPQPVEGGLRASDRPVFGRRRS